MPWEECHVMDDPAAIHIKKHVPTMPAVGTRRAKSCYLRLAPEGAPAANETEQTGCQKDEGTRLRNSVCRWRNRD